MHCTQMYDTSSVTGCSINDILDYVSASDESWLEMTTGKVTGLKMWFDFKQKQYFLIMLSSNPQHIWKYDWICLNFKQDFSGKHCILTDSEANSHSLCTES